MLDIPKLKFTDTSNFLLMAGPCVVESEELCFEVANQMVKITDELHIPYIFKASYRKDNRSRLDSFTGIGDIEGLEIIRSIGEKYNIPTVTDIHNPDEAILAAKYVDVLQIPAFLCRQTDLLIAAAKTGKVVNIKKGQFLSPDSMRFAVEKVRAFNPNVMLTERGTMLGYSDFVVDFRGIPIMKKNNCPVILDITHSLQQPNQSSGVSGGRPELIETIAKAGIAVGVDGIFMETHPNPAQAKSDGANMIPLNQVKELLKTLIRIRSVI